MPLPAAVKADVLNNTDIQYGAFGHFGATRTDGSQMYIGDKAFNAGPTRLYQVIAHETSHVIMFRIMAPPVRDHLYQLMRDSGAPIPGAGPREPLADCMASVYGASGQMDYWQCPPGVRANVRNILAANGLA
jgi:hypothetical protein